MENATKALTIAGGVLIAIIIIVTLWYSFQQWGLFPSAKDDSREISQLEAFNKEYESYNKKNLYGADIITVLNKAIANNERYGITSEIHDPYYIDVEFKLINSVDGYTKTIRTNIKTGESEEERNDNVTHYFEPGRYALSVDYTKLVELSKNEPIKQTKKQMGSIIEYTYEYPPTTEFRLKYFTCDKIEHNSENGRVSKIVFKEVNVNDLIEIK